MARKSSSSKRSVAGILVLFILVLLLTLALALFAAFQRSARSPQELKAPDGASALTEPTAAAEPPLSKNVVTADGSSDSLRCLDSYTVDASASGEAARKTVAALGAQQLTNAQLQIYYLNAIQSHRLSNATQQPELSLPLEQQLCPLGDGKLSWQHYFLQKAIDSWQLEALLLQAAQEPRLIQEEAYKPNETDDLHGKYVAAELPVNHYLYGDKPCYTPNSMHQAYLDSLEEKLNALASQQGFSQLSDWAQAVFGSAVGAQDLVEAARRYNTAYMLFTEESYDITVSQEQVDAYRSEHPDCAEEEARRRLTQQLQLEPWQERSAKNPVKADYSAAALWVDPQAAGVLPVDVLYPDVAHERFPEPITYFQQDYNYHPFGTTGAYVGSSGCGITTFAMLATYMTDEIHTPAMMADQFPDYYTVGGTKGELFQDAPEQLGFHLDHLTWDYNDVIPALENGQPVICLQEKGMFTSKGHYLLLFRYDREADTIELRDSNIFNYGRLQGHKDGFFKRADVFNHAVSFYIMDKKSTTTPTCPRCGSNPQPEVSLESSALCGRCVAALIRRNAFLTLMSQQ